MGQLQGVNIYYKEAFGLSGSTISVHGCVDEDLRRDLQKSEWARQVRQLEPIHDFLSQPEEISSKLPVRGVQHMHLRDRHPRGLRRPGHTRSAGQRHCRPGDTC